MCPIKHQKPLVFPFEVHTILGNPVLHINFFFSFAFTLFVYTNVWNVIYKPLYPGHTSLISFREGLQSRDAHVVSSSKSSCFCDFTES